MSFGLRDILATFEHLMSFVVSGVEGCAVFLDNIVVYSNTWQDHLKSICAFLDCITLENLTANLAKCEFARATLTYLGKVAGQGQVHPVRAKVEATDHFNSPTTEKELPHFLGMVGYYCGFCENFSAVVAPLTDSLNPKVMFQWSDHYQTIFEDIKAILASAPGLERPHLRDSFKLKVDASKVDPGAVLLHQDGAGIELLLPQVLFLGEGCW